MADRHRAATGPPPATTGFRVDKVIPVTAVFRAAQAAEQVLGMERVTARAVNAGYLTLDAADQWLSYLATQPSFAAAPLTSSRQPPSDHSFRLALPPRGGPGGKGPGLSPGPPPALRLGFQCIAR